MALIFMLALIGDAVGSKRVLFPFSAPTPTAFQVPPVCSEITAASGHAALVTRLLAANVQKPGEG